LRLDTDWYESTRHELNHLWDRVVPHGIVIIDDYDHWAGSRRAADDFFAARGSWPMLFRPGYGRALVKTIDDPGP
jgi:O-methyltransferase